MDKRAVPCNLSGMTTHDDKSDVTGQTDNRNIVHLPSLAERQRMQRETNAAERRDAHKPFINLPPATAWMLGVLISVQAVLSLVAPSVRYDFVHLFGFTPAAFTGAVPFTPLTLITPVTYLFIHGGWLHLSMNGVMLMAFGTGVERWIGARRLVIFCLLCGVISAFSYLALNPFSDGPVIGASGALSGLFAAILVMLNKLRHHAGMAPMRMMPLIVIWIVFTVVSGILGIPTGGHIAWAAHVGGFLGGFAVLKIMKIA